MVIQYICRGNAFRSIVAEAYTNSLKVPDLEVRSSGTATDECRRQNEQTRPTIIALLKRHGICDYAKSDFAVQITQAGVDQSDVIVFLNERARQEAIKQCTFSQKVLIWDVIDIGEPGKLVHNDAEYNRLLNSTYQEITAKVDELLKELSLTK